MREGKHEGTQQSYTWEMFSSYTCSHSSEERQMSTESWHNEETFRIERKKEDNMAKDRGKTQVISNCVGAMSKAKKRDEVVVYELVSEKLQEPCIQGSTLPASAFQSNFQKP